MIEPFRSLVSPCRVLLRVPITTDWPGTWFRRAHTLVVNCAYGRQKENEETETGEVEENRRTQKDREKEVNGQDGKVQEGAGEEEDRQEKGSGENEIPRPQGDRREDGSRTEETASTEKPDCEHRGIPA